MLRFLCVTLLIPSLAGAAMAAAQAPAPQPASPGQAAPAAPARRPPPPTRDPHTAGYVAAKELPDGESYPRRMRMGTSSSGRRIRLRRR